MITAILILICLIGVPAKAQLHPDTIAERLRLQNELFPNEKLHLHTDRSLYAGKDTIWFKAYLVNALDYMQKTDSRYIYTELVNPFGETVCRIKIRPDKNNLFHGYLPLDEDLPTGLYTLRAYTRYMQNADEDFFFHKPIQIVSPLCKSLSTQISYERKNGQKQVKGTLKMFNNASKEYIPLENIDLYNEKEKIDHWTEDKAVNFKLSPAKYKQKAIKLEAANFQQFLPISFPDNDFHVDFLPEGGNLPAGVQSKMAFKAINTYGLSENIFGVVKDEEGNEICIFQTSHAGMGAFYWTPEAEKDYYAECTSQAGVEKRFKLPTAETNTYTLNVKESAYSYHIFLLYSNGVASETPLTLLIHQRGYPLFVRSFQQTHRITLPKEAFTSGIVHLLLLSPQGKIISERQIFAQNDLPVTAYIETAQETNTPKGKIRLDITLKDAKGKPVQGNFSLAITNNADLLPDSTHTIFTSLLLNSELKGHIEDLGWYFRGNDSIHRAGLDLLMLTQGWRKYPIEEALAANYKRPTIPTEETQQITGTVKRLVGNKPIPHAKIQIHIPNQRVLEEVHADENGRFIFNGFEFPDSTIYNIQATTRKNGKNVLLALDTETFPETGTVYPLLPPATRNNTETPTGYYIYSDSPETVEFLNKAERKMTYENGMRSIFLEDVVVTAKKKVYKTPYESIPSAITIKEEELKKTPMIDLPTFLTSRLPGLTLQPSGLYRLRDMDKFEKAKPITIILNGFPVYDSSIAKSLLENIPPQHIEQIDYNRESAAGLAWFPMTGASFIAITLKKDVPEYNYIPKNIQMTRLLGYQKPATFYVPKYETKRKEEELKTDLRTTLYWNPALQTNWKGKASIEFYTTSENDSYSILLEGISQKGEFVWIKKSNDFLPYTSTSPK